jgi:hypothetical protein
MKCDSGEREEGREKTLFYIIIAAVVENPCDFGLGGTISHCRFSSTEILIFYFLFPPFDSQSTLSPNDWRRQNSTADRLLSKRCDMFTTHTLL